MSNLTVSCNMLTNLYLKKKKTWAWLSAWDLIEIDKNSYSLSALLSPRCNYVYSRWIEALLLAEALPVIGCL